MADRVGPALGPTRLLTRSVRQVRSHFEGDCTVSPAVLRECTAEIHELVARNSWPRFERSGEPYESVRALFLSAAADADAEPEAEAEAEIGVSFAEMVAGAAADADADAPKRPSRKSIDALCAPACYRLHRPR